MFDKWTRYSYAAQKDKRHRLLKLILVLVILFVLYNGFAAFFVSVWAANNDTMQPTIASGDRIIFNTFMLPLKVSQSIESGQESVLKRGSIVLVDMGSDRNRIALLRFIDSLVRFFTAQQLSIFSGSGQHYIKRIIAVPGDEISMENFVFKVKPYLGEFTLTEFELSEEPYHPYIPTVPALWDESVPFSGNMEKIVLKADEYFVVSDDRSNTNDSRTWGAVSASLITSRAVLRFWPPAKFGRF